MHDMQNPFNADLHALETELDQKIMFTDHQGREKRSIEKRQRKLLKKVGPFLSYFLHKNERILLITTGCSPIGFLDHLLSGWYAAILKRCVFVFTDQRILLLPAKGNFSPRNMISEMRYGDCQSILIKWGTLTVEMGGKKEKFSMIPGAERKKIEKQILPQIHLAQSPSAEARRRSLCPRCTEPLKKEHYLCPKCSLEFKNARDGKKFSLLFPGGGYFYTRHPFLGFGDALGESAIIVLLLASAYGASATSESFLGVGLFGVCLGLEKLVTLFHTQHFIEEYIPIEKQFDRWPKTQR